MAERVTDEDLDLLDELGVDTAPAVTGGRSPREQRIVAGFEEIERFYDEHGRAPLHGEDRDIFERLYAVRLERIRESAECRDVLKELDSRGLLNAGPGATFQRTAGDLSDDDLLGALGIEVSSETEITNLVHVRSRAEIKAAEEVARRAPCQDFDQYKAAFEQVQQDLKSGARQTVKFGGEYADVKQGDLFILEGQKVLVVQVGERFVSDYDRVNQRLRVVYDNGTESEPLLRSLQRALYEDKTSRRITKPGFGPLFSGSEEGHEPLFTEEEVEGQLTTGYVYVLRSQSEHPFVLENRAVLHKIGVTGGEVQSRVVGARKDSTYLLADVEIVAEYKLTNVNPKALEGLLHRFFASVRLDLELKDRFGFQVEPQEWFLVPLTAIDEAIQHIKDGTISGLRYDREAALLVPV